MQAIPAAIEDAEFKSYQRKCILIYTAVTLSVFLALLAVGFVTQTRWISLLAIALNFVSMQLVLPWIKKQIKLRFEQTETLVEATVSILSLAQRIDPKIERVALGLGGENLSALAITRTGGVVTIPKRLTDILEPSEIEFALAQTLLTAQRSSRNLRPILFMSLILVLGLFAWMQRSPTTALHGIQNLLAALACSMPILFFAGRSNWRRIERHLDAKALSLLPDFESTKMSILKCSLASPFAGFDDPSHLPQGSEIERRINSLRATAVKLGLPA